MTNNAATSGCRRPQHPTRCEVLRYYLDRATTETRFTLEDFAAALATDYVTAIPVPEMRSISLAPPPETGSYLDYSKAVGRLVKQVQRYINGSLHLPCELEESWCAALPEPYRSECRAELARRHGFLGVRAQQVAPCQDSEAVSNVMTETGEALSSLCRAVEDGQIDAADLKENPELQRQLLDAEAALAAVRSRVRVVANATHPMPPADWA